MAERATTTKEQQERPRYETPRIQQMTEKDILNTFQVTQSMAGWWVTAAC
jgi:hypothetical protein